MPITARKLVKVLKKHGYVEISQHGSHLKLKSLVTGDIEIILIHPGDLSEGTYRTILKKAGIKEDI